MNLRSDGRIGSTLDASVKLLFGPDVVLPSEAHAQKQAGGLSPFDERNLLHLSVSVCVCLCVLKIN